jgi:hypothetical protein
MITIRLTIRRWMIVRCTGRPVGVACWLASGADAVPNAPSAEMNAVAPAVHAVARMARLDQRRFFGRDCSVIVPALIVVALVAALVAVIVTEVVVFALVFALVLVSVIALVTGSGRG